MYADLAARYDLRVPRYTSYPTAPHFTPEVSGESYGAWLEALPEEAILSLYLHIPFCRALCWFCGCTTRVVNRPGPLLAYRETLELEIAALAARLGPGRPVRHVHFGGGSPNMLPPDAFEGLIGELRTRFAVADDAEIAIEVDPRVLDQRFVAAMAASGVNRVSIGVQDFDPQVQRAINRIQPYELTRDSLAGLRAAGITAINLDLLYGLPHQTCRHVERSAEQALSLEPQRLALFGYAHVPWMKRHQRLIDERALPDSAARLEQFYAAEDTLIGGGLKAVGIDHYVADGDGLAEAARRGCLKRNFQGYTADQADVVIGLGASAISTLPQGYAQNEADVLRWRAKVEADGLATARGVRVDDEDRFRRDIIERLMCDLGVSLEAVSARHGRDYREIADVPEQLAPMARDGLLEIDGARLAVTPLGRPFTRVVCAAFDRHLQGDAVRHATAL